MLTLHATRGYAKVSGGRKLVDRLPGQESNGIGPRIQGVDERRSGVQFSPAFTVLQPAIAPYSHVPHVRVVVEDVPVKVVVLVVLLKVVLLVVCE
jgi:hypothetical protein